jgi:hypothetical protein
LYFLLLVDKSIFEVSVRVPALALNEALNPNISLASSRLRKILSSYSRRKLKSGFIYHSRALATEETRYRAKNTI